MASRAFLDGSLRTFVAEAMGAAPASALDASRGHGGAIVTRLSFADGRSAALKIHRDAGKHRREVAAYRAWGAALAPDVPRLHAVRDDAPAAILLAWRAGRVDLPADDPAAPAVHRRAGEWLARLHRSPSLDRDPVPLDEAYRRRAAAWTARAEAHLSAATLHEVQARLATALPALAERRRVPCHRDMGPRNWLAHGGRLEAVIDFEHARPDVAEIDLVRLALGAWSGRSELRRSFLEGYRACGGPADPDAPWLRGLLALEALGTVAWAAEHADAAFERAGRAALARLLDDALA